MERWLSVVGFEGLYEVSDLGRVRSLYGEPHVLKTPPDPSGYLQVNLYRGGKHTCVHTHVHTLVLTAFVGPRPGVLYEYEGCHWNGIPGDCRLENLRWDTRKANRADAKRHGTLVSPRFCGTDHPAAKLNEDDVRCIRAEPRRQHVNIMLVRAFAVSVGAIEAIRSRRTWAHVPEDSASLGPGAWAGRLAARSGSVSHGSAAPLK